MTTVILNQPDELQDIPGVVIPAPETGDAVIKNTFFFPDVDPKRVRELMRLEQTVSDARLRNAIKTGMAETNAELYDYRLRQLAAGFKQLADVPDAEEIDGENVRVFHYLSAVTAMTTATLYERYRGVEATAYRPVAGIRRGIPDQTGRPQRGGSVSESREIAVSESR